MGVHISKIEPRRLLATLACMLLLPASALGRYTNFEITPVRPLALSADGARLYATNTPDGRIEIFDVVKDGLRHVTSVPVGLEPVALALRTPGELWVVNHLSDSVSIVDVASAQPHVVRTLLVGDQPWDVVFAGARENPGDPFPRAFISAARRGQNHPDEPHRHQLERGNGRADVWVFDADDLGAPLGGTPEKIIQVFGDKPRPLATSADGSRVYVGIFHSGSRTTVINSGLICKGGESRGPCTWQTNDEDEPPATAEVGTGTPPVLPGGVLGPDTDAIGNPAPERSMIVKYFEEAGEWRDPAGRNWNGGVQFQLPDLDVFAIDALAAEPAEMSSYAEVGTILFNMAVHPDGRVFVANTKANNFATLVGMSADYPTLRGHVHEAQLSILGLDGSVTHRHLNKHIDYEQVPQPESTRERSLATPQGMAFSADGRTLYLAAFGSSKVAVLDVEALADDSFSPNRHDHIELTDGGPAGVVVGSQGQRLYVYTRLGNSIAVVDARRKKELASVPLHNPEPAVVTNGRRFLYDARLSSSNGEASCSGCHVLGDMDDIAWDLGDPAGTEFANPNPFLGGARGLLHPVKGPMSTQTLRGLANNGPMHWRGDQTGARDPLSGDGLDELAAFRAFNPAFSDLLGRDEGPIAQADMQAFAEFALTIFLQPNPHRPLDDLDTPELALGRRTYFNVPTLPVAGFRCNSCHRLEPIQGAFGTEGLSVFDPGDLKIPHLRNVYEKVGAWGMTGLRLSDDEPTPDQIRGFGVEHDGSLGDVSTFLTLAGFVFPSGQPQKQALMNFVMAFPTDLAPIVGQQMTLSSASDTESLQRMLLLSSQAQTPARLQGTPNRKACDLVAHGVVEDQPHGWLFNTTFGRFIADESGQPLTSFAQLGAIAVVPGQEITFTCVPPGSGRRMAIDRDDDGARDGDERAAFTDPRNAGSRPGACNDGLDNDGDGAIDHGGDLDCATADAHSELPAPGVAIDIHPGSRRNKFAADDPGAPVALLGSSTVDVRLIDPGSLRLGPGSATALPGSTTDDTNLDGYPDLVARFDLSGSGVPEGRSDACVAGTIGGSPFESCDRITVKRAR